MTAAVRIVADAPVDPRVFVRRLERAQRTIARYTLRKNQTPEGQAWALLMHHAAYAAVWSLRQLGVT